MDRWSSRLFSFIVVTVITTVYLLSSGIVAIVDSGHTSNKANKELPFCNDDRPSNIRETVKHNSNSPPSGTGSASGPRWDRPSSSSQPLRPVTHSHGQRSLILVSTIDGRISALNSADGSILWSHSTKPDPLLSSTLGNLEFVNDRKSIRLVPSLDGDLYTFDGEQMGAIPLSMDALLSNSMKVGDDTVVTGGKEIKTYGISRRTGNVKYVCGMEGCDNFDETIGSVKNEDDDDVIVVRRLTRTVRAISPRTGMEKWNYSVGEHEVSLASNPMNSGCYGGRKAIETSTIRFLVSDGIVMAVDNTDPENKYRWKRELKVPIVHAWQLRGHEMEDLDLFDAANDRDPDLRPILHVGTYNRQLYILQSQRLREALQLEWDSFMIPGYVTFPRVTWRPYLISAHSRTPIVLNSYPPSHLDLIGHHDDKNTALVPRVEDAIYPYDSGFTLFTNTFLLEGSSKNDDVDRFHSANFTIDENEEEETLDQIIMVSLWYWWKEVLAISISFAVLINICITRHVVRLMKQKFLRESSREIVTVEQTTMMPCLKDVSKEIESHNSTDSQSSMSTPPTDFVSRYVSDFEPIQKLGKGGFGVVFQARNKIDDCDYAIKRICMPNRDDSRARIMREVKALAKLDHVSIVRYYNAWLECPPSDWQDDHFNNTDDVFTPTSSMTYEELQSMYSRRDQNGVGKKTPNGRPINNNIRDEKSFSLSKITPTKSSNTSTSGSFIVFENDSKDGGDDEIKVGFQNTKHSNLNTVHSSDDNRSNRFVNSGMGDGLETEDDESQRKIIETKESPFVWEKPEKLYLYIQMQLCQKDNLKDWLNYQMESRDKFEVLDYFYQIVSAVEYIHEQGLIHRDLKPSNIFFAQDGSIKVGDFGLAATTTSNRGSDVRATGIEEGRANDSTTFSASRQYTNQVGTILYMSPEQIAEEVYDHKVDIFSLGLIFFEMLVPFSTAMERVKVMMDARKLTFPTNFVKYSPDELSLVEELLSVRAEDRPCASNIKQHPLLQDFQPRPELLRRHRRIRIASRTYSTSSSGSGSGLGISID